MPLAATTTTRLSVPASLSQRGRVPLVAVLPLVALLPACVPAGDPVTASCGAAEGDCNWSSGDVAGFALPMTREQSAGVANCCGNVLGFYLDDCAGNRLELTVNNQVWIGASPAPGTYAIESLFPSNAIGNGGPAESQPGRSTVSPWLATSSSGQIDTKPVPSR